MTVTKHETDGAHPASHYLVVDDPQKPATWHLRVRTVSGALDHGLMGDAWAALHTGYRGNRYTGPRKGAALKKLRALYTSESMDTPSVRMAAFTLEGGARERDVVVRKGKIFEAGDYPDKAFSITPDELRDAITGFEPVPIDLEHMSTPLDGKLGELTSVEVGDDGFSLFGTVTIPLWLDTLLEGTGRRVSATWDRATKRLLGLALVNTPRITDAALMAAFAAISPHKTSEGSRVVQAVHDMTAKSGAVCTTANPNGTQSYSSTYFHSAGEVKTLQALHDACTAGGAKCNALSSSSMYATMAELAFAGSRHSKGDLADIQTIHDLAHKQGADCAPVAMRAPRGSITALKGTKMSFTDAITDQFNQLYKLGRAGRDLLRRHGGEIPDENVFDVVDEGARFAAEEARTAEMTRLEGERTKALADVETLKREALRLQVENMTRDAASFADALIVQNRIVPAQKDALVRALVLDAQADAALGPATFADGASGTRVDATKTLWASMPVLGLTGEKLRSAPAGFSLVPADGSGGSDDDKRAEERRLHILKQTTQGRQHLAKRDKRNA